ncbi:O-antigen ligase family protein [Marinicellulosiphila megalodicopiae]|uniref:O-antigen ligase family protein n=1 Tax=Marinicellulosiphila megalodicopiae TaxID=2724896 RepID=UPI003BB14EE9
MTNIKKYLNSKFIFLSINVLVLAVFFILVPWVNHVFAAPVILFALLLFVSLFDKKNKRPLIDWERWLLVLLVLFFVSQFITKYFIDGYRNPASFEQSFRFFIGALAYLYYRKYPINWNVLAPLVAIGCISAGIQAIEAPAHRLVSVMPAIKYGTYSALISVLMFYAALHAIASPGKIHKIKAVIYFICMIVAAYVNVRAESKMPVLAMFFGYMAVLIIFIIPLIKVLGWKIISALLVVFISLIAVSGMFIMKNNIGKRFNNAVVNFNNYEFGKKSTASTSLRLDMWSIAKLHATDSIILGNGQTGVQRLYKKYSDEKMVSPSLKRFQHMHNDYIDIYMKSGLFGLMVLLGLYFVLLKVSLQYQSMPIFLFVLINMLCGLTDITFSHMISITVFLTFLILLLPNLSAEKSRSLN